MIPGNVPPRRFLAALGLSLLVHVLLAGSWIEGVGGVAVPYPLLQARLENRPAMAEGAALAEIPGAAAAEEPPHRSRVRTASGPTPLPAVRTPGPDPAGTDARFYLARELDHFPEPVEMPAPRKPAAVAHVRIWVGIDQQGRVVDVVAAESGYPLAGIRERLLAIRFVPARKDGYPVKSRVLMEWPES